MTDKLTFDIVRGIYPLRESPDFDTRFIVDPGQAPSVNLALIDLNLKQPTESTITFTSLVKLKTWAYLQIVDTYHDGEKLHPSSTPTDITNVIRMSRSLPLDPDSLLTRPTTPEAIAKAHRRYNRFLTLKELERLIALRDVYLNEAPGVEVSTAALQHQIATLNHHITKRVAPLVAAAGSAVGEKVLEKLGELTGLASAAPSRDDFKNLEHTIKEGVERITNKIEPVTTEATLSELDKHLVEEIQALRGSAEDATLPSLQSLQDEITKLKKTVSELQSSEDSAGIEAKVATLNTTTCRILKWLENRPICPWPWPPPCL